MQEIQTVCKILVVIHENIARVEYIAIQNAVLSSIVVVILLHILKVSL